jgi:NADH dehydrogenase
MSERHAVTGAFSYSGRYIAGRLLARGVDVVTLTNHPPAGDDPRGGIIVKPLAFDDVDALAVSLSGARVLYNTYWIRFERGDSTFARAVANTKTLIAAAERAGVARIVHVSIANAPRAPDLPYYSGKAELEAVVRASTMSHAIIRPTVIFSLEDVLINNIAWLLRRFPVFAVPGDGAYGLRPIHVEDMADLAVGAAFRDRDETFDAVGLETFTFDELARLLARSMGRRARLVHVPAALALTASRVVGVAVRDVVLTRDEIRGLTAGLLVTDGPATGRTRLSEWLREHGRALGRRWASELARHYR